MLNAIIKSVQYHHHLLLGKRVWLACSGGRDSLALAYVCHQLYHQQILGFLPQLLHVNHGLQKASDTWASMVKDWAKKHGMVCHVLMVHLDSDDEQSARYARYQAMASIMNQEDVLMLAHHADDQAETLLMRLLQGAGVDGLAAMPEWRIHRQSTEYGQKHIHLWRPWLGINRQQITNYAHKMGLPYIDDPTNVAGHNTRSWLRQKIFPELIQHNPKVIANMARSAALIADAKNTVQEQASMDLVQVIDKEQQILPLQTVIDLKKLMVLPKYRQSQLLKYWLQGDEPVSCQKRLVDDVMILAHRQENNHQTLLEWQAIHHSYQIKRYRQFLYRFSSDWLHWLRQPIHSFCLSSEQFLAKKKKLALSEMDMGITHLLRRNNQITLSSDGQKGCLTWQIHLSAALLVHLFQQFSQFRLNILSLPRTQSITLLPKTTAYCGKKLYQELAIPTWQRESVVLVSIQLFSHTGTGYHDKKRDIPDFHAIPLMVLIPHQTVWTHPHISQFFGEHSLSHRLYSKKLRNDASSICLS